jgi:hypothetical protein
MKYNLERVQQKVEWSLFWYINSFWKSVALFSLRIPLLDDTFCGGFHYHPQSQIFIDIIEYFPTYYWKCISCNLISTQEEFTTHYLLIIVFLWKSYAHCFHQLIPQIRVHQVRTISDMALIFNNHHKLFFFFIFFSGIKHKFIFEKIACSISDCLFLIWVRLIHVPHHDWSSIQSLMNFDSLSWNIVWYIHNQHIKRCSTNLRWLMLQWHCPHYCISNILCSQNNIPILFTSGERVWSLSYESFLFFV